MSVNEIVLPVRKPRSHLLTLFLGMVFFGLVFYFRNSLDDFSQPFALVFIGIITLAFISGRYETYILLLLIATSTVFDLQEFGTVPIQIGDLFLTDLLIIILLLAQVLKRVTVNMILIPKHLGYPILTIILVAIFSFVYATMGLNVSTFKAGIELRIIIYLSIFFLVYHYIKTPRQLHTLLVGSALVALIVSGMILAQYVLGNNVSIVFGRVEILSTQHKKFSDITRVMVPGSSVIFFTLNTLIAVYVLKALKNRSRSLILPAIAVISFGLILTFTRIYWVMVLGATILLLFMAHRRAIVYPRMTFLVIGAAAGVVLILQSSVLNSTVIKEAMINRSISILKAPRKFREDTLFMRYLESRYAWEKILENPFLGIGLGNAYRPKIFGNSNYERNVGGTSVHNGYLATQLKMGIMGTVAFFWLMIAFFYRVFKRWKDIKEPLYQAVVVGIAISVGGMLIHNLVASPFLTVHWVTLAAIGMGVTEKIFQIEGIA